LKIERAMKILQINAADGGGAEKLAFNLLRGYRLRGHQSWLAVSRKGSDDECVLRIPNEAGKGAWFRFWTHTISPTLQTAAGAGKLLRRALRATADPVDVILRRTGVENFRFPSAWRVAELPPGRVDIVHLHNLHGDYFDLRALP
jgi:hypothetical protein